VIRKLLELRTQYVDITLREKCVRIAKGARGEPEHVEEHELPSVEKAQYFMADTARAAENRGLRETLYEETYDDGQRDAGLEAAIAGAPDEAGGYLVYADWLQQRSEPRGELIVVQRALAGRPADRELRARERALLAEHSDRLLGPLALIPLRLRIAQAEPSEAEMAARADWHCGFVRTLDLSIWLSALGRTLLRPLFAHATFRFLHSFAGDVGNDTDLAPLADRAPSTLRWLRLDGDRPRLNKLRKRLARLPPSRLLGVEHLQICGRTYRSVAEWLADGPS
jgi:uncharacterized protein (TIGR02996 family)